MKICLVGALFNSMRDPKIDNVCLYFNQIYQRTHTQAAAREQEGGGAWARRRLRGSNEAAEREQWGGGVS